MRSGFHTVYLEDRPVEEAVRLVSEAGYAHIELNAERLPWAEPHVGPLAPPGSDLRAIAAVRAHDLPVSAIGAHCELLSLDFETAVDYGVACIEFAAEIEAPVVHVLSGERPPGMSQVDAEALCVAYGRRLVQAGASRGVTIAWEAIVGMAIATSRQLDRILQQVDGLAVNFDPSHLHLTDGDAVAAAKRLGSRTVHFHVKDAAAIDGGHEFPPLGEGDIDLQGVVDALSEAGYDGVASVEWEAHAVGGYPREDSVALDASAAFLNKLGIQGV